MVRFQIDTATISSDFFAGKCVTSNKKIHFEKTAFEI